MNRPDGFYDATINSSELKQDGDRWTFLFRLQLFDPTETTVAYHDVGEWKDGKPVDAAAGRFADLLETFGIDGIRRAMQLLKQDGTRVRARVKTNNNGKQKCYVATTGSRSNQESVNEDAADRKFAELAGEPVDPLPF